MEQRDARRVPATSTTCSTGHDGVARVAVPAPVNDVILLHDALLGELRDLYGANTHLHTALTLMATGPHAPAVRVLIVCARRESSTQLWRLERIFGYLGEDIGRRHCLGMARILDGRDTATGRTRSDASIAATVLRAAHFLSAVYATAAARARALGYSEVASQLDECVTDAASLSRRVSRLGTTVDGAAAARV